MEKNLRHWAIDIGNTRIKSGVFLNGKLLETKSFTDLLSFQAYFRPKVGEQVIMVSVKWNENELKEIFNIPFLFFDHNTPLPIFNAYASPGSLGLDRLAAVVGGRALKNKGPVLCIDLGTCITYDFLDGENKYQGGAISPGVSLRARSMHEFTARLPLVHLTTGENIPITGRDTVSCMQSGIFHGVAGEMSAYIRYYQEAFGQVYVFICGGDAEIFESLIKDHIFVIPNLVLYGLDRILTYNVEK
ncbi:type III pantothenate kinase [Cyclobacterium plantarum]|uniref:Type III pantothenate kinase n=1 Tax=Cyclobacterium plantarum TaxID=2716263 RepID=A0ABX0H465_9BACT|nr:type III pantothenate kinase [Cyclobacterium plantarum]NHE55262.1 type III pantothenate kinase [Cyclobacterium plantarum]